MNTGAKVRNFDELKRKNSIFCYYHLFNNIGVTYFANKIEDFANKMQMPEPSGGMHNVP